MPLFASGSSVEVIRKVRHFSHTALGQQYSKDQMARDLASSSSLALLDLVDKKAAAMKSRAAVLERRQSLKPALISTDEFVPAINAQPMGPDREDEYAGHYSSSTS